MTVLTDPLLMDRSSATAENDGRELEELLDTLELPPGYKAELAAGKIIVAPPPTNEHQNYVAEFTYDFNVAGWRTSGTSGLITPLCRYIPDLTVARKEFFRATPLDHWLNPKGVALVAEVTSSNPDKDKDRDRDDKRRGYAEAKIPLYLLIDRKAKETVLFSKPETGDYAVADRRPIDKEVPLPQPFSFTLKDFPN